MKSHMRRILFLFMFFLFAVGPSFSQEYKEILKDIFYDAEYFLADEYYIDALQEYQKLYARGYEDNANINYRIGICYLNIPGKKQESIPFLEKAVSDITSRYKEGIFTESQAPYDAYLYLGNAYRIDNRLENAVEAYRKYKELLDKDDSEMAHYADQQIEACNNARKAMESPVYYIRTHLSKTINTGTADYNPVVSADGKSMVYMTSLAFYDALKYTTQKNGSWTEPLNITPEVQSDGDQYADFLTADGRRLYLNKADNFNSDIYYSDLVNGKWTRSKPLNKYINTKYFESHACVSPDDRTLYFTSNRKGGQGGMDIWVSRKDATGDWGDPLNIGKAINTGLNEDNPFITSDGKTLFFASQGHYSLGGYDIFRSEMTDDGGWSRPVNLGYPVNTTDDDLFYVPTGTGDVGYQSLFAEDSYGSRDIYQYRLFPGEAEYLAYLKSLEAQEETEMASADTVTKEEVSASLPDTATVAMADTAAVAKADTTAEITGPGHEAMTSEKPNEVYMIQTIFFGFDQSTLTGESRKRLDVLANVLDVFPSVRVVAIGNTDSRGTEVYNVRLSERRATAAMNYLIDKGVSRDRISTKALGEDNPVAVNHHEDGSDAPEGRKYNRRVEFNISNYPQSQVRIEAIPVPEHLKLK